MPTITAPPTDKIASRSDRVARVLTALGHPEAFVSDESTLSDFRPIFGGLTERSRWLTEIRAKLGIEVSNQDYIWQIAEKLP